MSFQMSLSQERKKFFDISEDLPSDILNKISTRSQEKIFEADLQKQRF